METQTLPAGPVPSGLGPNRARSTPTPTPVAGRTGASPLVPLVPLEEALRLLEETMAAPAAAPVAGGLAARLTAAEEQLAHQTTLSQRLAAMLVGVIREQGAEIARLSALVG